MEHIFKKLCSKLYPDFIRRYFSRRKFRIWALGNQHIPVLKPEPEFIQDLRRIFKDYRKHFDNVGYDEWWEYSKRICSFTHYLYTTVSHYKLTRIYEIGTYKGASGMMLLNYFIENGIKDFYIHSIDINPLFDVGKFSQTTRSRFEQNREKILFEKGDSQQKKLTAHYDLTIIDGAHDPESVLKDFETVRRNTTFILFDDLHQEESFEGAYLKILREPGIKEIFRIYTEDKHGRHCIGLIKIHS